MAHRTTISPLTDQGQQCTPTTRCVCCLCLNDRFNKGIADWEDVSALARWKRGLGLKNIDAGKFNQVLRTLHPPNESEVDASTAIILNLIGELLDLADDLRVHVFRT